MAAMWVEHGRMQQMMRENFACKDISKTAVICKHRKVLVLNNFFLRSFTLMRLENLHHFLNLCDNFWFNAA